MARQQPAPELLTVSQAATWATNHARRNVTPSNISYLIQYGRVKKYDSPRGVCVSLNDLLDYYASYDEPRETNMKARLGEDINWTLSFADIKEAETTKHVHRLHPYKGKFIPHLVNYFVGSHTDSFKREVYFKPGDIVLDPFCGSGTTLVQASELGINAVGIDISAFNALISNCKVGEYDLNAMQKEINRICEGLRSFNLATNIAEFEQRLLDELNRFNAQYFPVPEYKYNLRQGEINEKAFGSEKEREFLPIYEKLVNEYGIQLRQEGGTNFLGKWFSQQIRNEIDFVSDRINEVTDPQAKKLLSVILSRTMRSCRATTHSDLATLIEPVTATYYCTKHGKMCKPLFSIVKWWESYCRDTLMRISQFAKLRTNTAQHCITGDSRGVDIIEALRLEKPSLANLVETQRIAGIFSSPPYVGMIDYHEQHAYAYDLFGFARQDEGEIGPLFKGKGKAAQAAYAQGISDVLNNCKRFLTADYNIFLVANDKNNLYPTIAQNAGMEIVNTFRRPVLNRSEKDKTAYSETIFHMKERGMQ